MANNTLFSNKDVQNNVSRNGFDLSKRVLFTAKVGELLPIYHKRVMPGDKFSIDLNSFTRTQPVNTAAYTRIKEYYDFFYIPYRLLWRNAPASLTQMSSVANTVSLSPTQSLNANKNVPYFPKENINNLIASYVNLMETPVTTSYLKNQFGFFRYELSFKLLSYLGYTNYNDERLSHQNIPKVYKDVCAFPLLAYQKIYYDFFRNPQWEHNRPECYNVDYLTTSTDLFTLFSDDPVDGSTFWSTSNMFDMRYCNYEKDMFTGALPNTQFGSESVLSISGNGSVIGSAQISPGSLQGTSNITFSNGSSVAAYRPSNTEQYPDGNFETKNGTPLYAIASPDVPTANIGLLGVNNASAIPVNLSSLSAEVTSNLSILALRRATALQKYKEISQLGNTTYRAQIKKHFGVDIPESLGTMCTYIGGFQNAISINEVVNQNLDSSNSSALIRGKGTSIQLNNNPIDFDVKEHGIIMCVYHAVPLMDYCITGQSRDITAVDVTDYAIPEFDRLGFEPADAREFFQIGDSTSIYGYLPRYYSYKTDVDNILGAFNTTLPQWTAPYTKEFIRGFIDNPATVDSMYNSFKVNPSILNRIFPVAVDSTVDTDQLLCTAQFSIHAVRNLDFNGLPY